MTLNELTEQYRQQLKDRLTELVAEQCAIEETLGVTTEDPAPKKKGEVWTEARRKKQSRALKRYHQSK